MIIPAVVMEIAVVVAMENTTAATAEELASDERRNQVIRDETAGPASARPGRCDHSDDDCDYDYDHDNVVIVDYDYVMMVLILILVIIITVMIIIMMLITRRTTQAVETRPGTDPVHTGPGTDPVHASGAGDRPRQG